MQTKVSLYLSYAQFTFTVSNQWKQYLHSNDNNRIWERYAVYQKGERFTFFGVCGVLSEFAPSMSKEEAWHWLYALIGCFVSDKQRAVVAKSVNTLEAAVA